MVNAVPSRSGIVDSPGGPPGGKLGTTLERKNGCNGWLRASAGGLTALGRSSCVTKVSGESDNPSSESSFATKNVFDVLQDLSERIWGLPGPQPDAVDGLLKPITHDLHRSLIELLEKPEILSLHAVRRLGRVRQLHLKIPALCGEVERVFDVLTHTGPGVSLIKAGPLSPECLAAIVIGPSG